MDFQDLLSTFCAAVEAGDGDALAATFTPDGVYDDVFYGEFAGRDAISDMLTNYFYRDGKDFRWRMIDPVSDGETGYARWAFSFTGKVGPGEGRRIFMDGVGLFKLRDGLIARYEDIAKAGEAFVQLGHTPEKVHRLLGRMAESQRASPDAQTVMKI